ncbi:helix-turn-helix domain-containing protein, partial [Enterococcus faecium]|nr:helix-turn-helix domain-containing protein [Enterococcus faecium]
MYKEQLLDNQTRKEYLLIKLLYLHDFRVEKKLVCEKLNISYPTIKKIIDRINDYLETYYPQEDIELLSTKHDLIFHNNSSIPVDDLTKFYFIHSEKYILLDLLFKSPHITRNKLSQKMNISSTTLNIIILQCNELLKEFELQISHGTIKGNLVQYFYFYFLFYWWTNSSPFSYNSETQYLDFDQFLYEQNQEKLGPIEEKKLFLWLTLLKNQRKIVNTYSISSNENIHVKDNQLYHELKIFFKKHWKIFSTEDISKV